MRSALIFLFVVLSAAPLFAGADADLRKGNKAYDNEKYGQAFEFYNKAAQDGANDKGFYNSGAALYRLQDYDAALQAYEAVEDSSEFKQSSYYNAANAYYNMGNSEEAIKNLRRALLIKRDDKEALHNLQFVLKQQQHNKNKQDKNNNQGENNKQQDNQDNSDKENQSGNSGSNGEDEEQQNRPEDSPEQKQLSPNEADNILQMSKEHSNNKKKDFSALGAGTVEKDW
ncbi:MAG: tetratricopeptide repeat protein [Elusimicrobiaceae bacterium]